MTAATTRWDDLGKNWTVRANPDKSSNLLVQILTAEVVWRNLTKPQRELLLSAVAGCPVKPRADVRVRLIARGLIGEDLAPTEAGRLVVKWRCP